VPSAVPLADCVLWRVRLRLSRWKQQNEKKGEETLYREEKYAAVYEINMLRCIFCGLCEEACPKEAIFLTDRIVPTDLKRNEFIYGKDKLVEDMNHRIDLTGRQTKEVLEFKKDKTKAHNQTWADKQKLLSEKKHH
jgi:formate hydrogenlyase subunit 6/NADH:ubiquinone oxidoreductase subunit I